MECKSTVIKLTRLYLLLITPSSAVFHKLKRLEHLDISENKIAFLSSELKCLKFLKTVVIKKNQIKSVALDFGMSQSIEKLNLAGNSTNSVFKKVISNLVSFNIVTF